MKIFFLLAALTTLSNALLGRFVADIKDCPPLFPRFPPNSVHDLRPDDIKVVGALGDSVMTGYGAKDIDISKHPKGNIEYRGISYAIGGDEEAPTLPNYIKHYRSRLVGYSLGQHEMANCNYGLCFPHYELNLDVLNAAQGAAPASTLDRQLTYIITRMRSMKDVDFQNDWKLLTIQTGSNDLCQSCVFFYGPEATPEKFEKHIDALLERIQAEVPRVLVNLLDAYNITQSFEVDGANNRCKGSGSVSKELECPCGADKEKGWERMANLSFAYNEKLEKVYQKFQKKKSNDFAVVYQKMRMDYRSAPEEFYSNFDCYHPSTFGHKFMSTVLWNQMFLSQKDKPKDYKFSFDIPLYCPTEFDRLLTY